MGQGRQPRGLTGIILAGGLSRRLGRDKAVESVGGEPLIHRVMARLRNLCDELVVVVNTAERARSLPLPPDVGVAVDRYPGGGSLGGIFSGLAAASGEWGLVVACDMPFLNLDLLRYLLSLREGHDVVMPMVDGRPEPIHALYRHSCLPAIEKQLRRGELKIARFFDRVRIRYVPQEDVVRYDPDLLSFFNINTQEDLDQALSLVGQGR